ncbi:olfactory receptor 6J1-like [Erythrolamprus reginae]|uniref:olfactory receptor 6J1-like n=1 Tax=Erythrolamprus reginae TaxID=121349 RepID=UPI00396CCBA2
MMGTRTQNSTAQVTEFILIGFQLSRTMELFFVSLLLVACFFTLSGNLMIITLVCVDRRLQTPMYFFLSNLSFLEIFFVLTIVPKMMMDLFSLNKSISFLGCITQCYSYFFFGTSEIILIAVMAFDRYVAVCHPLRYTIIMNGGVCVSLILVCWVGGFLNNLGPIILLSQLTFCSSNVIDHFFCDYAPLIKLSCNDVHALLMLESTLSALVLLSSMGITVVSYLYIIVTVLGMQTSGSRRKTFSTCASHLIVASIFYGSAVFMYSFPSKGRSRDVQKAVALLNSVITPLLNPFIYTLRNEKVKDALRNCLQKHQHIL